MSLTSRPLITIRKRLFLCLFVFTFAAVASVVYSRSTQMAALAAVYGLSESSLLALVVSAETEPNATANAPMLTAPSGTVQFDFDGDGKADVGRWHSSNTEFKVQNSNGGSFLTTTIGSSSSKPAPFDFDGDSKTDVVVFNAGTWNIKKSSDGTSTSITGFGQAGDIPVAGDWVGTSLGDAAIYRPSTGFWYFRDSNGGAVTSASFGTTSDIPVAGNYDGDSKMDMAVFRPSTGDWHINGSTSGYSVFHWGIASDLPVPADYDGDGNTDKAVFRPSSGTWYADLSGGAPYITKAWGNYGDQPVPADYDGDGKADFTVWRPTTGVWYSI